MPSARVDCTLTYVYSINRASFSVAATASCESVKWVIVVGIDGSGRASGMTDNIGDNDAQSVARKSRHYMMVMLKV